MHHTQHEENHMPDEYVTILDSLHGKSMPLYHAMILHNAVDEITERDTYVIVTLPNGTEWQVVDIKPNFDTRYANLTLHSEDPHCPPYEVQYDTSAITPGVLTQSLSTLSVRMDGATAILKES
jgi:hypothetical protein